MDFEGDIDTVRPPQLFAAVALWLRDVDQQGVAAAAARHLKPDELLVVVVGDDALRRDLIGALPAEVALVDLDVEDLRRRDAALELEQAQQRQQRQQERQQ